jgi:hypothetical protein
MNSNLSLVKIIEQVRWQYNCPQNRQASDWTSFDIAIAQDQQGNLFWGQSVFYPNYVMEKVKFYPVPQGIGHDNIDHLTRMEEQAPWLK